MSTVQRKSTRDPVTPPTSPNQTRLVQKMANTNLGSPQNSKVNWGSERVFSPGQAVGYKTPLGIEYVDGNVRLFQSGPNSQGLIIEDNLVVGASVTTTIHTETARDKEKKKTFIQYDKTRVNQEGADFQVKATNRKGEVNYQGGHLIDHKYSAQGSHTTEPNYFPQHFMVNAPFKEYLVQRSSAFIEIPLYTPHPPTIGVKDKDTTHPIPIGEVFIQINNSKIAAVYFFPNNFDYETLKEKLRVTKEIAATMTPNFKLKPCFYPLFLPALVTQFGNTEDEKREQSRNEAQFIALMDEVTCGIARAKCDEDDSEIVQLAYSVVHKKGHIDPSLVLNGSKSAWNFINDGSLQLPFDTFGKFIVTYVIRNALKSEVISIHSRLVFLSGVIDFAEAYSQVTTEALEFIDTFADEFESTFEELHRIKHTMNQEELFFFTDLYQRLSDSSNHDFSLEGYDFYFRETDEFFFDYINLLKHLASCYKIVDLRGDYADRFLDFIRSAQDSLDYWIETGFPEEEFESVDKFLKSMIAPCLTLFDQQNNKGPIATATFQTNIHHEKTSKYSTSYIRNILENLGLEEAGSESD